MKFNKEKGITIITLVITVIVLVILTSITIYTGGDVIKQAKLQTIDTNMMLIQAKTKTIEEQSKFNKDKSNYKGTVVSNITGNNSIDNLKNMNVIEDASKYYLLSESDLVSMGLNKIDYELGYIVNYETEEVIYVKGFSNNGKTYYKLSEIKNLSI